jgi:hypothetical protein
MDIIFEIIDNDFEFFQKDKPSGHYARGLLIEESKHTYTIKLFCNNENYKIDKSKCKLVR